MATAASLITGAGGFAGRYLAEECLRRGDELALCRHRGSHETYDLRGRSVSAELTSLRETERLIQEAQPKRLYHLAAQSHVGRSWGDPGATMGTNVITTANVLAAVAKHAPECRVVLVSSGEVYGRPHCNPVDESHPIAPQNPYAVSKVQVEAIGQFYVRVGELNLVIVRPFAHAGPRQAPRYAVSNFARQFAAAVTDRSPEVVVRTGNADVARDYTDVRDVVRAYASLAETSVPGPVNIASGRSWATRELIGLLAEIAGIDARHVVDPALVRDHEVMNIVGANAALQRETDWRPEIPLEVTARDTYLWWLEVLARDREAGEGQYG